MATLKSARLRDYIETVGEADKEDKYGLSKTPTLPSELLDSLRGCLDAGLTCEEIVSFLRLSSAVREANSAIGGRELVVRTSHIVEVLSMEVGRS